MNFVYDFIFFISYQGDGNIFNFTLSNQIWIYALAKVLEVICLQFAALRRIIIKHIAFWFWMMSFHKKKKKKKK